jgi:hypothetical protein
LFFNRSKEYVNFFYEQGFFHPLVKHRAYNFTDLLALIGGLLGLIAGVSFISLMEIACFSATILCKKLLNFKNLSRIKPEPSASAQREPIAAWSEHKEKNALVKYFLEVFRESSIHGLSRIISKHQSTIGKVLWTAIVVISTITCGSLIANYVKNMQLNPVAFEIDERLWSVEEVSVNSNLNF